MEQFIKNLRNQWSDPQKRMELLEKLNDNNFSVERLRQIQKLTCNENCDILRVGTSAGGAKPKAIIAFNENTQEIRSGQVKAPEGFSYWLLKFDGVSYREHDSITDIPMGIGNIEFAYYRMALEAGIRVNEYSHRRNPESDANPAKATLFVNGIVTVVTEKRMSFEGNLASVKKAFDMCQSFLSLVVVLHYINGVDFSKKENVPYETSAFFQ